MVHPQPGDQLEQVEHLLAFPHPVDEHGRRAQFQAHRADRGQVRADPVELHHQHPQHVRARRDLRLDPQQALHAQAVRGLVEDRRQVVRPGAERDALRPGAELHVLLDAGVQVADHRPQLDDGLAFQGQDQPEHAVRGGVLRPHVDDQALLARLGRLVGGGDDLVPVLPGDVVDAPLGLGGHWYALLLLRRRHVGAAVFHRDAAERVVLAPRVALPVVGHLDPGQRGMAVEDEPEEVPGLPLVPVAGRVDAHQRRHVGIRVGRAHLQPQAPVVGDRQQRVDGVQLPAGVPGVVHAAHPEAQLEGERRLVPQHLRHRRPGARAARAG